MAAETPLNLKMVKSKLTPEQQAELAVALGLCLECGGKLCRMPEGEHVCTKCGTVYNSLNLSTAIPFPEEDEGSANYEGHWQPVNSLAFMKGLGDPALNNGFGKALMRVLAYAPKGAEDLGLRARNVKFLVANLEPAQLKKLLARISLLLDRLNLRGNHEIANYTGNLARKVAAFCLTANVQVSRGIADAIVKHALEKFKANASNTAENLNCKAEELNFVIWLEETPKNSN